MEVKLDFLKVYKICEFVWQIGLTQALIQMFTELYFVKTQV
jgi:hypothetical protein